MSTTRLSMNSTNIPFLLSPAGKDYLWGGNRLKTDFNKQLNLTPLAETWECSTHPEGVSMVASGIHQGMPLDVVLREHPEYLGSHPLGIMKDFPAGTLPILIKLIDASSKLSVQVHPDDTYAKEQENGALGKTEMWYVLDAKPDAHLIYGFRTDMTKESLLESLANRTLEKYLQKVPVKKNDIFFIKPGMVHAIGEGVVLAEIQENSNLTYRLYDYERVDKDGQKRPLHIEKAADVLVLQSSENPRQPMRTLRYHPGYASELIGRCKYFQTERILINTKELKLSGCANKCSANLPDCTTDPGSFQVLLCLEGEGEIILSKASDDCLPFAKGSCIFLPANSTPGKLQGQATLLKISC